MTDAAGGAETLAGEVQEQAPAPADLPRVFTVREAHHRILDPFTPEKLAILGKALRLRSGQTMLDLACGKGETLATWAREHGIHGTGVDLSSVFVRAARERAWELGVSGAVTFIQADASGYVAERPVDIASCCGATWIGGGVPGTIELLERSLKPGGLVLIGEPFWRRRPPDEAAVRGSMAQSIEDFAVLPRLVEQFVALGWDVVEMVLADQDSWDRYVAAQWMTMRRFIDEHPDDELTPRFRAELDTGPARYVRYQREYLGWGVFVLQRR